MVCSLCVQLLFCVYHECGDGSAKVGLFCHSSFKGTGDKLWSIIIYILYHHCHWSSICICKENTFFFIKSTHCVHQLYYMVFTTKDNMSQGALSMILQLLHCICVPSGVVPCNIEDKEEIHYGTLHCIALILTACCVQLTASWNYSSYIECEVQIVADCCLEDVQSLGFTILYVQKIICGITTIQVPLISQCQPRSQAPPLQNANIEIVQLLCIHICVLERGILGMRLSQCQILTRVLLRQIPPVFGLIQNILSHTVEVVPGVLNTSIRNTFN